MKHRPTPERKKTMTDKIVLEVKIPLECHVVQADVSVATEISHVLPILMHVQELEDGATPESLSDELFHGRKPLSQRLLDSCCDSRLLEKHDQHYFLTEDGILAIEGKRVFVSKKVMWKIYYSPHPIIPGIRRVLKIDHANREAGYREEENDQLGYLKQYIQELARGQIMVSCFGENRVFRINMIEGSEKIIRPDINITLHLEIDQRRSTLRMISSDENDDDALLDGPDMTYDAAWSQLLEQERICDWDSECDRLQVPYYKTTQEERRTMKKTLRFNPRIMECEFNPMEKTVDIYPKDQYDAQRWADDLFVDGVKDYLTCERYQKIVSEIKTRFPDFEISLSKRANNMAEEERGSPRFWYIQAAEDWSL